MANGSAPAPSSELIARRLGMSMAAASTARVPRPGRAGAAVGRGLGGARRRAVGAGPADRDGAQARDPLGAARAGRRRQRDPDRGLLRRARPRARAGRRRARERAARADGTTICDDPTILAGVLRRGGLRVRRGPIASSQRLVLRERRRDAPALAARSRSTWSRPGWRRRVGARPLVTLRVVLDTHRHELHRPLRTAARGSHRVPDPAPRVRAGRGVGAGARRRARSCSPRRARRARASSARSRSSSGRSTSASRRSTCASRSSTTRTSSPICESRGAVFVDELDEVPPGSTVIFSAHGVSPAVRRQAAERELEVIDATCPLVAKVHAEARRFAAAGLRHRPRRPRGPRGGRGHLRRGAERTHVIATPDEVARARGRRPREGRLPDADDARRRRHEPTSSSALRERFPALVGPPSSDICYATQNRQDAVRRAGRRV